MKSSLLLIGILLLLSIKPSKQQVRAWINEIHYNKNAADNGFFLEVAHSGGHIYGYSILFYKIDPLLDPPGTSRQFLRRIVTFSTDYNPEDPSSIYYKVVPLNALPQIPDGFVLVDNNFNVFDFVSFGTVYGYQYPVDNRVAFNIGAANTNAGFSLQLCPDVFRKWSGPSKSTPGLVNRNCKTSAPSGIPSMRPSKNPTEKPITDPTNVPTKKPSTEPTISPSSSPSEAPNGSPSAAPSKEPSSSPSEAPNSSPSAAPSKEPSSAPSEAPNSSPSTKPSIGPSTAPSTQPIIPLTNSPSGSPSENPTEEPSKIPSQYPNEAPSQDPSAAPDDTACAISFHLYNSRSDLRVATLTNGVTIPNPPPCGKANIEAVVPCGAFQNRVLFELWRSARRVARRTDTQNPYFLFGNSGKNVMDGKIAAGKYGIRVMVDGKKMSPFTNFTLGGKCWCEDD